MRNAECTLHSRGALVNAGINGMRNGRAYGRSLKDMRSTWDQHRRNRTVQGAETGFSFRIPHSAFRIYSRRFSQKG